MLSTDGTMEGYDQMIIPLLLCVQVILAATASVILVLDEEEEEELSGHSARQRVEITTQKLAVLRTLKR
jgi:hypothetical protein